jgi:hypothetical protein
MLLLHIVAEKYIFSTCIYDDFGDDYVDDDDII